MKTAAGISSSAIWRTPLRARAAKPVVVAARGVAGEGREQHGRDRDAEDALRQHVEAERAVDRGRRRLRDERAERRVDQRVEVDQAEAERHRQHQHQHGADARVAPVERDVEVEADALEHRQAHRELRDGAEDDRDRVRVDLVGAMEQRLERDQPHDDHEVPDHRRDRRDREVVVGVEDPDDEPVEPEQQHDREQDAAEADGQLVELGRELAAGQRRDDHTARSR